MPEIGEDLLVTYRSQAVFVVTLQIAELTTGNAEEVRAALTNAAKGQTQVAIDLSALGYVDFVGFESLLQWIRQFPGTFRFAGASSGVESLFHLAQLNWADRFHPSIDAAIEGFCSLPINGSDGAS